MIRQFRPLLASRLGEAEASLRRSQIGHLPFFERKKAKLLNHYRLRP